MMFKFSRCRQIPWYPMCIGLSIVFLCIIVLRLSALSGDEDEGVSGHASEESLMRFAEANSVSGDYSQIIGDICDNVEIGVIHSYSYYETVERSDDEDQVAQTQRAKQLLQGISRITWSAMHDEMSSAARLANLEQLLRLEKHILKEKVLGTGSIQIADGISGLISALVFQEVAESEIDNLPRVLPFIQRDTLRNRYTMNGLKELLGREMGFRTNETTKSQYELLVAMLFHMYTDFADKYRNGENADIDSIMKYAMLSHSPSSGKSIDQMVDVDPFSFVTTFLVARNLEMCARFAIPCRKVGETSSDRMAAVSQFYQGIASGMTDFEREMYGNPRTEEEISNVGRRVGRQVRDNLKSEGKHILESIYRRFAILSDDGSLRARIAR